MKLYLAICIVIIQIASLHSKSVPRSKKEDSKKYANLILPILEADQGYSSTEYKRENNVIEVIPYDGNSKKHSTKWKDLKHVVELKPLRNKKNMKDAPLAIIVAASDFNEIHKTNQKIQKNKTNNKKGKGRKVLLSKNKYEFRLDSESETSAESAVASDERYKVSSESNVQESKEAVDNKHLFHKTAQPESNESEQKIHKSEESESNDKSSEAIEPEASTETDLNLGHDENSLSSHETHSVVKKHSASSENIASESENDETRESDDSKNSESTPANDDKESENSSAENESASIGGITKKGDAENNFETVTGALKIENDSKEVKVVELAEESHESQDEASGSYENYSNLSEVLPVFEDVTASEDVEKKHFEIHRTSSDEVNVDGSLQSDSKGPHHPANRKSDDDVSYVVANVHHTNTHDDNFHTNFDESERHIEKSSSSLNTDSSEETDKVKLKKFNKKVKILDLKDVSDKQTFECLNKLNKGHDKNLYKSYNLSFLFNKR